MTVVWQATQATCDALATSLWVSQRDLLEELPSIKGIKKRSYIRWTRLTPGFQILRACSYRRVRRSRKVSITRNIALSRRNIFHSTSCPRRHWRSTATFCNWSRRRWESSWLRRRLLKLYSLPRSLMPVSVRKRYQQAIFREIHLLRDVPQNRRWLDNTTRMQ